MAAAAPIRFSAPGRLVVPVHRVKDVRTECPPEQLHHFWSTIWPEAVRDFSRGGIELHTSDEPGEVRRSPGDKPIFIGLRRGVINLVLTGHLPLYWDNDRALAGVTALFGQYLCARAFARAAAGHLRQPPEVAPVRRARIPNRLVCKLPLAIPRRRRHSGVRPGLSRSPAIGGGATDTSPASPALRAYAGVRLRRS